MEADPRHVEEIVTRLGLNAGSKGVTTPGVSDNKQEGDIDLLNPEQVTEYRSLTMKAAYMSTERVEIAYAVKNLARNMSQPNHGDWRALKRLGRYLSHRPRTVQDFPWQDKPRELRVEVDSDFAGCDVSRKSTSGFSAYLGSHCVATKCKHQSVIALSSGEAEFYAGVSGISRALGLQQQIRDWGITVKVVVGTDSTSGLSLATRFGLGRAKHIHTQYLWVQDLVAQGGVRMVKVPTDTNSADLFTKHLAEARMVSLMGSLGFRFPEGSEPGWNA